MKIGNNNKESPDISVVFKRRINLGRNKQLGFSPKKSNGVKTPFVIMIKPNRRLKPDGN